MKRVTPYLITLVALLAPLYASAAKTYKEIVEIVLGLLNDISVALIALAVLMVAIGIFRYIAADETAKRSEGRAVIVWGIISLFLMVSVWGLVNLLLNTLFPSTTEGFQLSGKLFSF